MNPCPLPVVWLELAIVTALASSLLVSCFRDPLRAWRWGLTLTGAVFVCSILAFLGFFLGDSSANDLHWSFTKEWLGQQFLDIDELSAPLIPLLVLIHFLTTLATGRTKMRRFSLSWSLAAAGIRLAIFGSQESWLTIALLILCVAPPYVELRNRGQSTRVYVIHMSLFVALLVGGWALIPASGEPSTPASIALMLAVLIRCGTAPAHCWITDWFEHASFGNALLFVTPLMGVYVAVRLVLPVAPDWVLASIGVASLFTAVYAAGMAIVQQETRRFFAYLFLSHASLILVGLELHTPISLTGALSLWVSAALSVTGFGLTLRALEARFGQLSLARYHGLYNHSPALAICFLLTGLASIGFPGTLGFVAGELLVDGAVHVSLSVGFVVCLAGALNSIAVVRAYACLFTGARHVSNFSLGISRRERIAVLTLAFLILAGGLLPQPGISSRHRAAMTVFHESKNSPDSPVGLRVDSTPSPTPSVFD